MSSDQLDYKAVFIFLPSTTKVIMQSALYAIIAILRWFKVENYHEHVKMTKMRTASGKEKRGAIEVGIAISDVVLILFR